jgi:GTP-binding protein
MNPQSVVLVGRPNVGKSTLFNRLTRSRTAITDPTPGVTRDCIEKKMAIGDNEIILVDTGGFKMERQGELEEAVYNHAVAKIETSGCVVLILEGGELSAEDEELILMLRPHIKKIIVAVNKCEGGRNESDAWNYLKFGFAKILFISAEHGDNIGLLVNDISEKLFSDKQSVIYNKTVSEDAPVKIAIVGKPNTGKSTLSNLLLRRAASIVSNVAGTTRDVIEGEFQY